MDGETQVDGPHSINWKSAIELFSIILSLSFLASAIFFYFVFYFWGANYFFLATGEDVILGGLFVLMTTSSTMIVVFASEFKMIWNVRVGMVLLALGAALLAGMNGYWYYQYNQLFPGIVSIVPFRHWTALSVMIGIFSTAGLIYWRSVKRSYGGALSDLSRWTSSPQHILILISASLLILTAVGDQARSKGFLDNMGSSAKLGEFGCPAAVTALWAGARFTVLRCKARVILAPSSDVVLSSQK